jgi:hypothetical protein
MNVGIVVEGPSDRATYPTLMRRIRDDIGWPQARECGGRFKLKEAFPYFLAEFQRNPAWQIDVAFVIRDSDCKPPQRIEDDLRRALKDSRFDFPIEFFATKCDLETWLLVDENAINQVSRQRGKNKQVEPVQFQFESETAKKLFHTELSKADLRPVPDVYKEVATCMDLKRTAALCPSFRAFVSRIRALTPLAR